MRFSPKASLDAEILVVVPPQGYEFILGNWDVNVNTTEELSPIEISHQKLSFTTPMLPNAVQTRYATAIQLKSLGLEVHTLVAFFNHSASSEDYLTNGHERTKWVAYDEYTLKVQLKTIASAHPFAQQEPDLPNWEVQLHTAESFALEERPHASGLGGFYLKIV